MNEIQKKSVTQKLNSKKNYIPFKLHKEKLYVFNCLGIEYNYVL